MNLVLCHADWDGKCAGAIVSHFVPNCELYPINYGYSIPWNKIKKADKVFMVDFGLQPFTEMLKLREMKGKNFIWIDHHKTAIEAAEKSGQKFEGVREIGMSGCELTWDYFSDEQIPLLVRLLGRYDVWDMSYSKDLTAVQCGFSHINPDVDNTGFWDRVFINDKSLIDEILTVGGIISKYKDITNTAYCNSHAFDLEWEGLRFLAANALNTNSQLFDSRFNHIDYDAVLTFGYTNGQYSFSMYTDKPGIDVSVVAKKYGGGGHAGACGFQKRDIPFRLPIKY